jgi:hypothetical protein
MKGSKVERMNVTATAIAESGHPCFYFHNTDMHHAAEPKLKKINSLNFE